MLYSVAYLMYLERGILSEVLSEKENIDTGQLKWLKWSVRSKTHQAGLIQPCWVKLINSSQHSIWASLVGTHQFVSHAHKYAQYIGLDSRCVFAPAVFVYLWKVEHDSSVYLFTYIFYLNIWRNLENVINWFAYSIQAAFPSERLGMGAFRIALESVFNR